MNSADQDLYTQKCIDIANAKGGKFLSQSYTKSHDNHLWSCSEGHIWEASFSNVNAGKWCRVCARKKNGLKRRIDPFDVEKVLKERDGKIIEGKIEKSSDKIVVECSYNHRWVSTPGRIKRGYWCIKCQSREKGIKRRVPLEVYRKMAAEKGGVVLNAETLAAGEKLKLECAKGHRWNPTPSALKRGCWCPHCAGKVVTIDWFIKYAEDRNGKCLSKTYKNEDSILKFECYCGNRWENRASNVKNGSWCPECRKIKLTLNDCYSLARSKGGDCLSTSFTNRDKKAKWVCKNGHTWVDRFDNASHFWCPECKISH